MARLSALLFAALMSVTLLAAQAPVASAAPDTAAPDTGTTDAATTDSGRARAGGEVSVLCVTRAGDRVHLPSRAGTCPGRERTLVLRPSRRRSLCLAPDAVRRVGPGRCDNLGGVLTRVPARKPVVLCATGRSLTSVTKASRCAAKRRWTIRNHAPADLALRSNQLTAPVAPGAIVGAMSVVEVDRGDHVNYSLVGGEGGSDNARFALDGALLRAASALPAGTYSIRVRARDLLGRRTVGVFTVAVASS